jgi:hypothetical protein
MKTLTSSSNGDHVTMLALSLRPRQRHEKVRAESLTWESHLHSWECERMNTHTPKWTLILGDGIIMESQIFKEVFQGPNSLD